VYTTGGAGGQGGAGKPGASNPNCPSFRGLTGAPGGGGPAGEPGEGGTRGDDGQPGEADGSVKVTFTGNCAENPPEGGGGGGDPYLEPGDPSQYCTPWYWVWYHCENYQNRLSIKDERNISAHHSSGSPPVIAFAWECVEVGRWYAGCW
jgi:hypothetical protein